MVLMYLLRVLEVARASFSDISAQLPIPETTFQDAVIKPSKPGNAVLLILLNRSTFTCVGTVLIVPLFTLTGIRLQTTSLAFVRDVFVDFSAQSS
jgi:hypothetical protein